MEKENQVKYLKDRIKGLGANKTENSIVAVSKSAPVILDIVENIDKQIDFRDLSISHTKRSKEEDLHEMLQILRNIRPFQSNRSRTLPAFRGIKCSVFQE